MVWVSRLRSSTAPRESSPISLKAWVGLMASGVGWLRTAAIWARTSLSSRVFHSAGGVWVRRWVRVLVAVVVRLAGSLIRPVSRGGSRPVRAWVRRAVVSSGAGTTTGWPVAGGLVEQVQAFVGGHGGQAHACHAGLVGVVELAGHAAGLAPQPPGHGDRGESVVVSVLGEGVQEGVGRGVVGLSGAAEDAGGRGEQDERRQVAVCGEVVQVQGGVEFGFEDLFDALAVQGVDDAVGQDAGGVDDRTQRVRGGDGR